MTTADELLAGLSKSYHEHEVTDPDSYFVIDPDLRTMTNLSRTGNVLMQRDHKSERYTFQLPRYVEGHDMMLCNRVLVHFNNIDGIDGTENADVAELTDLRVNPDDSDTVIVSWLIERHATQKVGILSFLVQYMCVSEDDTVDYEWHTDIYEDVEVRKGRNNSEAAVVEYSNILEQWHARLFGAGDSVMEDIANTAKEQEAAMVAAIQSKGEETLASIPDDYTELYKTANNAVRTRANAIVQTVEGSAVSVNDASGDYLRGLRIFGKSTQDGTPTPDAPVEIVSVENPVVTICGKNFFDGTIGTYAISQETISANSAYVGFICPIIGGHTYTISRDSVSSDRFRIAFAEVEPTSGTPYIGSSYSDDAALSITAYAPESATYLACYLSVTHEDVSGTHYQVELGDKATEYEPYKEAQTVTIPRALPGIPVSTGGNYTDSNGQQWICDEVDFERGVYVQRMNRMVLNGGETITQDSGYFKVHLGDVGIRNSHNLCSHYVSFVGGWANMPDNTFQIIHDMLGIKDERFSDLTAFKAYLTEQENAGKPVVLAYQLYTPIETPLSEEELFRFSQLHSNYPNTTVLNDAGAWMEVKYNADTALFFENSRGASDEQVMNSVSEYVAENGIQVPSDEHISEVAKEAIGNVTVDSISDEEYAELMAALEEEG